MHATRFVESYFDAWNRCDPEAVADHLSADGIYLDVPENVSSKHDELIISLSGFFADFPQRYELIGEILTGRNTIAFQYRVCPLDDCENGQSPTSYCGAEFMTLNGDAAISITDYYDLPQRANLDKYAKSGLRREQMHEYMQQLDVLMESQQVYLRPNLTLPVLAEEVGCSVNHLSQVINAGFEMSFFDYVNNYRVRHAKDLLLQIDGRNGAILNIAFTVGFNSNSAFYAAFKKHVGMAPATFRRSHNGRPL
ncbi:MAG: helix-turn-helix domain-containing protein [Gammaproteobacteria bacterium]|nr:helix-turn-helix domain-containing protein [Gammaproteobacteria bacterium]